MKITVSTSRTTGLTVGIAREAVAGNGLVALFVVLRNLQRKRFGGLLQNALRLLGALQQIADLVQAWRL